MDMFHSPHHLRIDGLTRGRRPSRRSERLVSATLRCQLCTRPVGDLVGYLNRQWQEARFIPVPAGALPHVINGTPRCAHCHGRLFVDDVEPLGRAASLSEVGGESFAEALASMRGDTARAAGHECINRGLCARSYCSPYIEIVCVS